MRTLRYAIGVLIALPGLAANIDITASAYYPGGSYFCENTTGCSLVLSGTNFNVDVYADLNSTHAVASGLATAYASSAFSISQGYTFSGAVGNGTADFIFAGIFNSFSVECFPCGRSNLTLNGQVFPDIDFTRTIDGDSLTVAFPIVFGQPFTLNETISQHSESYPGDLESTTANIHLQNIVLYDSTGTSLAPEPSTCLLLIGGFAALGARASLLRRRY
ncbi:MAG TPA: hypothetical protein VFA33_15305 [Bryobacteraceae bacterium]|nr:hypothetical protein [Bryobacteraceae bacterium]